MIPMYRICFYFLAITIFPVYAQQEIQEEQQDQFTLIDLGAILVSTGAISIALFSLWKNHLTSFNLETAFGTPTLFIYHIGKEKGTRGSWQVGYENDEGTKKKKKIVYEKTWWIPSFDLDISFHNTGQKIGKIHDIRIIMEIQPKKNEIKKQKFAFYTRWIVQYEKFQKDFPERFKWLESSTISKWYPQILIGKETKQLHIVLEAARWDERILGDAKMYLEVRTTQNENWKRLEEFSIPIHESMYEFDDSYGLATNLDMNREQYDNFNFLKDEFDEETQVESNPTQQKKGSPL